MWCSIFRKVLLVTAVFLLVSCASDQHQVETIPPISAKPEAAETSTSKDENMCSANDFLATLSIRQKLAQLLVVGVKDAQDARQIVTSEQIGGIFIGSWTQESVLTDNQVPAIAAQSPIALTVAIDEEGGRVSRIKDIVGTAPSARKIAETMTVEQAYSFAYQRGLKIKELGITLNFAPVVDVTDEDSDQVIGDRSFSADPEVVVAYAGAYARGMQDAGVFPVLKHFPGHGSASGDSHKGEVTTPPLSQLQLQDLLPYRELVSSRLGVMLGHLNVPGLTKDGEPASLSSAAVRFLREGSGYGAPAFSGPIYTDDLSGMRAVTDAYRIDEAVVKTLQAGTDVALWLTTQEVPMVLDTLERAVQSGALSAERMDSSVVTVLKSKGVLNCG
ncbi:MAG: glycoside hydrolase family 3 N-terminal domain-containing protein [Mycobacteriaceae bacterium]